MSRSDWDAAPAREERESGLSRSRSENADRFESRFLSRLHGGLAPRRGSASVEWLQGRGTVEGRPGGVAVHGLDFTRDVVEPHTFYAHVAFDA